MPPAFFAVPASVTATDSNADDMIILWGEEATVKALKLHQLWSWILSLQHCSSAI